MAAARETEEDPILCAMKQPGMRCRHYALCALAEVFQPANREDKERLSRLVGCWGKPLAFWSNSAQVTRPFASAYAHKGRRWAAWFQEEAFQRVVAAIHAASSAFVSPGKAINEFDAPITMRRPVVRDAPDVTAELMGDPAPGRSALASAKPWTPYGKKLSTDQEDEHGQ